MSVSEQKRTALDGNIKLKVKLKVRVTDKHKWD